MIPKFRAWHKDLKKMFYDIDVLFRMDGYIEITYWEEIAKEHREITFMDDEHNFIVMQSTGLKDKNGKEIFEGDIIHLIDEELLEDEIGEVVYFGTMFALNDIKNNRKMLIQGNKDRPNLEVIGNIHENPELLSDKIEGD